jgi:hypothetical protein
VLYIIGKHLDHLVTVEGEDGELGRDGRRGGVLVAADDKLLQLLERAGALVLVLLAVLEATEENKS